MGDDTTLSEWHPQLSQILFDARLKIKRLLHKNEGVPSLSPGSSGIKLPKVFVPVFSGNIVNWRSFWEQFTVSVHNRSGLSLSEELTYLEQAVKDGFAKHIFEGFSTSGDQYEEAVDCLRKQYDWSHLLH